jgi:capsule biosynthesis phosphatase
MKTFVFDIDNTLCKTHGSDYTNSQPIMERIRHVNSLYDSGHTIILVTARGMGRSNNNSGEAHKLFYAMTQQQVEEWGILHHHLFLGKPAADYYIDDKGINDCDFFEISSFE